MTTGPPAHNWILTWSMRRSLAPGLTPSVVGGPTVSGAARLSAPARQRKSGFLSGPWQPPTRAPRKNDLEVAIAGNWETDSNEHRLLAVVDGDLRAE